MALLILFSLLNIYSFSLHLAFFAFYVFFLFLPSTALLSDLRLYTTSELVFSAKGLQLNLYSSVPGPLQTGKNGGVHFCPKTFEIKLSNFLEKSWKYLRLKSQIFAKQNPEMLRLIT